MQGGCLPKGSLIFENDHRAFAFAFFLDWGKCSAPLAVLLEIGLNQPRGGSLHRVAQLLQQFAHMPRVIRLSELLFDNLAHHRTGPNPGFQTVSAGPLSRISHSSLALPGSNRGPAAPMSPISLSGHTDSSDRSTRNRTAMHLQVVGYFSRRLPFQAHQNPLDAEHDSWLFILLCLPSKFQQLGDGGPLSFSECWAHIAHPRHFADYVELFMRTYITLRMLSKATL